MFLLSIFAKPRVLSHLWVKTSGDNLSDGYIDLLQQSLSNLDLCSNLQLSILFFLSIATTWFKVNEKGWGFFSPL